MATPRVEVGVLGATGPVGQQFIARLASHPWFRLAWVGASLRSEGKRLSEIGWQLAQPLPDEVRDFVVQLPTPGRAPRIVFSALDAAVAATLEPAFAAAGHIVISNASSHRMDPLVPLLVPEINADHLGLVPAQQRQRGWTGAIVTNPNCSTVFLAMALGALRDFGPRSVLVTTLQAISGAGYPGVASLDIVGNVIPRISGEEEKVESETKKILGAANGETITPHPMTISATTTRVPVIDGHTELVSVAFDRTAALDDLRQAIESFSGRPQELRLPSAPVHPIVYLDQPDRPQPRLDVGRGDGMTVSVGRLRRCAVLDAKFVVLGHNTVRGAAGAALLNAELMLAEHLAD
jgi:aspartate-semialdehyde dehydrogenase